MKRKLYKKIFTKTVSAALMAATVLTAAALSGCDMAGTDNTAGTETGSSENAENADGSTGRADGSGETEEDTAWTSEASDLPAEKNEVITVKANPTGSPIEITSAVTLKLADESSGSVLQDQTNLSQIKNSEGDEEFSLAEDGTLLWQNHGADLSYEGTYQPDTATGTGAALSDASASGLLNAALPVNVSVTYYLDGVEKTYEEIKGSTGEVKIRFDYTNTTGQYVTVDGQSEKTIIPFLTVSAAVLDEDIFSNVEVTNGELIELEGSQIAAGMAFPGLNDYLDLSSYEATEDMDPIADYVEITAYAEKFELEFTETMISNGLLKDMEDDSFDDIDDLMDAMEELGDASEEILDGIGQLYDGADEFQDYLDQYMDGVDTLADGAKSLADGAKQLDDNKAALEEGANALSDGLSQLDSALSGSGNDDLKQVTAAMTALKADLKELGIDLDDWENILAAVESYVEDTESWKQEAAAYMKQADEILAAINTDELSEENAAAVAQARAYLEDALQGKFPSAPGLNLDADTISSVIGDIQSQMQIIASSAGLLSGLGDSITQMQTAVSQLSDGSSQLAAGISAFNSGISQLSDGAGQLSDGCSTLSTSGHQLTDGFDSLVDGIRELKEGYAEFDEEGIQELADLSDGDLKDLLTKVKALRLADQSYDTFSGKPEGVESSAMFLIETAEEE